MPFERDEGEYAWSARLWNQGGLPYRDSFLQKPPGILLIYRAVVAFRDPIEAIRAVHVALLLNYLVLIALLAWIARQIAGRLAGIAAALLLALVLMMPVYQTMAANTEAFMVLPVCGAMLLVWRYRQRRSAHPAIGAGLLIGAATMIKQVAIVHAVPVVLLLLWMDFQAAPAASTLRGRLLSSVRSSLLFVASTMIAILAPLIYFVARGALSQMLDCVLWHNFEYIRVNLEAQGANPVLARLQEFTAFDWLLWGMALCGIVAALGARQWFLAAFLGGWLASAMVGFSSGHRYRGHYLVQALPPLCLCGAVAIARLAGWKRCPVALRLAAPWVALLATWWWASPWLFGISPEAQSVARYPSDGLRLVNSIHIARFLRAHGYRSMFILSSEPEIHFYSGIPSVSRYVIMTPIFGGFASSRSRAQEVFNDLTQHTPDVIIIGPEPGVPMFPESDRWLWDRVMELVHREYRLVALETGMDVGVIVTEPDVVPPVRSLDLMVYARVQAPQSSAAKLFEIHQQNSR